MKIEPLKVKKIKYTKNKVYILNNIDKEPLNENSDFLIASITKLFTSLSLILLHQQKKININSTLQTYLNHKELENVKIIDIMNHISGIKQDSEKNNNSIDNYNYIKKEKIIKHKRGTYVYSNLGYMILGVLIETVTSNTYQKYIYENILKPLKMNDTSFNKSNITFYKFNIKKLTKKEESERFNSISDGGLKSSISDLIKFKQFPKLLTNTSLSLLQKLYFITYNKEHKTYDLYHNGNISGIYVYLFIKYNSNWQPKEINIEFNTNI